MELVGDVRPSNGNSPDVNPSPGDVTNCRYVAVHVAVDLDELVCLHSQLEKCIPVPMGECCAVKASLEVE